MLRISKIAFPGLGIGEFEVSSVAFTLFGIEIAWYALIITFGMICTVIYTVSQAKKLFDEGVIQGGMIPKVECCTNAIKWGVRKVFIIDGTIPHSILIETLTDEGIGTMFTGEK